MPRARSNRVVELPAAAGAFMLALVSRTMTAVCPSPAAGLKTGLPAASARSTRIPAASTNDPSVRSQRQDCVAGRSCSIFCQRRRLACTARRRGIGSR